MRGASAQRLAAVAACAGVEMGERIWEMSEPRKYLIYESRACCNNGTDDATLICTADDEDEARREARSLGYECAVYSCGTHGHLLTEERWEFDYIP